MTDTYDPEQVAHTLAARHAFDVANLKIAARALPWNGRDPVGQEHRIVKPSWSDRELGISLLLTLDEGPHASGWWRNSDYDKCWHLSMVAFDKRTRQYEDVPDIDRRAWPRVIFGDDITNAWNEPPAAQGDPYRNALASTHTWHTRIFINRAGQTFIPEGEVYTLKPWAEGDSPPKIFR